MNQENKIGICQRAAQAWRSGDHGWIDCTQDEYDEMLGVLPPACHQGSLFAMGEPYTHVPDGPVYYWFTWFPGSVRRYACRLGTKREILS